MISPRNPLQMFAGKSILGKELALISPEAIFENFLTISQQEVGGHSKILKYS